MGDARRVREILFLQVPNDFTVGQGEIQKWKTDVCSFDRIVLRTYTFSEF